MEQHGAGIGRVLALACCVAGIWSAYIYQGVLQETLSTKRFGPDGKRFEHLAFLNLAQNVVCFFWAWIMIKLWSGSSKRAAPWWSYWSASITNTIGPAMGIEALKYISYPAQVLRKSAAYLRCCCALRYYYDCPDIKSIPEIKRGLFDCIERLALSDEVYVMDIDRISIYRGAKGMIGSKGTIYKRKISPPVMLMGAFVYGIKYTVPDYICTFLVAGGVSAFALSKTSQKTISKLAHPNAPLGYTLCFLNLALDGFTNATQDSLKGRYPDTSGWDIMLGMNLWGAIYNIPYMFGWSGGSGFEAVQFCKEHPEAAWDILWYCLSGAVGQNFIFWTISSFGSLANTTITTTRKFASIVVSSLLSGNPLSLKQWGSVFMVFSGLSYKIFLKWTKQKHKST